MTMNPNLINMLSAINIHRQIVDNQTNNKIHLIDTIIIRNHSNTAERTHHIINNSKHT